MPELLEREPKSGRSAASGAPRSASAAASSTTTARRARRAAPPDRPARAASSRSSSPRAFPRHGIDWTVGAAGGPRVLGIAELERIRDALAGRLAEARAEIARRADGRGAQPRAGRADDRRARRSPWVRVRDEDIGERSCKHWHSRPRWGLLGMLLGWWRVKLSSGCPVSLRGVPTARPPRARRRRRPRRSRVSGASAAARGGGHPRSSGRGRGGAEPPRRRRAGPRRARRRRRGARFPLVELVRARGIVMLVLGFFVVGGSRGRDPDRGRIALGSLGGLELSHPRALRRLPLAHARARRRRRR